MNKLSIITVNLNNAAGLQKTMESVFSQTFTDYEYIIIDGGSSDGSRELIEKYKNKLVYWVSEKDGGIYDGLNKGIINSGGEYLMFLNSGDYLLNNSVLQSSLNFISRQKGDIYYGNMLIEREADQPVSKKHSPELTLDILENETINHQASFIKKTLFYELGMYDLKYKLAADHAFFLKSLFNGKKFIHINEDLIFYDLSGQSSNAWQQYAEEMVQIRRDIIPQHYRQLKKDLSRYQALANQRIVKFALRLNKNYQHFRKSLREK